MTDELMGGLLNDADLRVLVVTGAGLAREAQARHPMEPAAAEILAQAFSAALLLAALHKDSSTRINLQLECDGPLRGLLVDAGQDGTVRGYVKNPLVAYGGAEGTFHWRPVLGNSGFLSVLRDRGTGDFYRSSVELQAFDLARDLEAFFAASEQLESVVSLETRRLPDGQLASAGLLVQPLPGGDREALAGLRRTLVEGRALAAQLEAQPHASAAALATALFDRSDFEVMSRYPVGYQCSCSKERVMRALASFGADDLEQLLAEKGKAEATCEFCGSHYALSGEELRALIDAIRAPPK